MIEADQKFQIKPNWPLVAMLVLAVAAVFSRLVLTRFYEVPQLIRFYLADFGSAAVLSVFLVCAIHLLFANTLSQRERLGRRLYIAVVVFSALVFLNVEREDYYGTDDGDGLDPGMIIEILGAPNTDTFDPWDLAAIVAGGILTGFLMWQAAKQLRYWHRFPLLVRKPVSG